VAVVQIFGDFLSFNPHIHILAADGYFCGDGFFYVPSIDINGWQLLYPIYQIG
jgi:hypothetical protein